MNRQRLIQIAHLAGCWFTCPSSSFNIPRAALFEPVDERLFLLEQRFSALLNVLVGQWEELHWRNRSKKFTAIQNRAIKTLKQIQRYETLH